MVPPKILIVEDESIVALDISCQLTRQGYHVIGMLATGEAAVEQALLLTPDLILMDIRLQGEMDGLRAAELIRQQTETPVIFLSAYVDPNTFQHAEATKPAGYLKKPFKAVELYELIKQALKQHFEIVSPDRNTVPVPEKEDLS